MNIIGPDALLFGIDELTAESDRDRELRTLDEGSIEAVDAMGRHGERWQACTETMDTVFLCRLDELPDGDSRGFDPWREGQDRVLVVRRGEQVHGWRDACPHHGGTPMAWRKDAYLNADRTRIVCAAHGAQFDIETGVCTLGPCLGQRLQPVELFRMATTDIHIRLPGDKESEHGSASA